MNLQIQNIPQQVNKALRAKANSQADDTGASQDGRDVDIEVLQERHQANEEDYSLCDTTKDS